MKSTYLRFGALLLIAAMTPIASGAHVLQDDVASIVAKTERLYNGTSSAKLTFSQSGSAGNMSGTLEYATGNKFRLTLPDRTIVSNGSKTWTYFQGKNQVVINKAAANGQLMPSDILQAFPGDYKTTLDGSAKVSGADVWVVKCEAGGSNRVGDINNATLYIDKKTNRFRRITVSGPATGTVTINISSAQYNIGLPASRFTFTPPEDARVIDLSR